MILEVLWLNRLDKLSASGGRLGPYVTYLSRLAFIALFYSILIRLDYI